MDDNTEYTHITLASYIIENVNTGKKTMIIYDRDGKGVIINENDKLVFNPDGSITANGSTVN